MTARGLECPNECGGTARSTNTGRANDGTIFLRRRTCDNPRCGYIGYTFETWFEGATIVQMDEELKFYHMMRERRQKGYHGLRTNYGRAVLRFGAIHYSIVDYNNGGKRIITDTARSIYRRITSKNRKERVAA